MVEITGPYVIAKNASLYWSERAVKPYPDELPIEWCKISVRTANAIRHLGTVGAVRRLSNVSLWRMPRIGKKTLAEIREELGPYVEPKAAGSPNSASPYVIHAGETMEDVNRRFEAVGIPIQQVSPTTADIVAKALAIKLAVSQLEKINNSDGHWSFRLGKAEGIIKNLLIGLGCQEVVDAWEECT